ncbi:hypothetical protein INP51_00900 [Blautia liquoris]|jgi:hypothetical protein|uniref:DUF3784 domain-containing protein n=1 Tax=Blautia liquoris TaxID=2779518 RepID=A0A7M2RHW7_9FIRM|nr:hypothetical protein [Blautia liquoris]QOV19574.1 hypothetical protein INP51_00900 [Blautia liquoris]
MAELFNWFLAIALGAISIAMFIGKGDAVLDLFDGKKDNPRKRWPEEKRKKFNRGIGYFTGALAIAEVVMGLFSRRYPLVTLGVFIFMIVAIFMIFQYIKKNF